MKCWTNECYNMYCNYRGDREYFLYKKQIDEYKNYEEKTLPEWYRGLSFHDNDIINAEYENGKLILTLNYDLPKSLPYKICFYDYEIIESCNLINAWIIADELYLEQGNNEFHLLVDSQIEDSSLEHDFKRAYFTVRFSKMEMIFNDLICSLGDGVDEASNPKTTKSIFNELCKDSEFIKESNLNGSKIINVNYDKEYFIITLTSLFKNIEYKIFLYNYEIVKYANIMNSVILSNQLYITKNKNKLNLFVMHKAKSSSKTEKFEIKFKTIKFSNSDILYQAGDGIDESLNKSQMEIATSFFSNYL